MTDPLVMLRRVIWIGLAALIFRLVDLQIVRGAAFRRLADNNRLRLIPQAAPRGLIVDREGRRLATTAMQYRVAVVPQEVAHRRSTMKRLGPLVGIAAGELDWRFDEDRSLPFLPATLVPDVPKVVALRVEQARLDLPGVVIEQPVTRAYPLGSVAASVMGYVGPPDPDALPSLKHYGVTPQEMVGRAGLERTLDAYLRGQAGGSLIEVNHLSRQMRIIGHREPLAGQSVQLTLDAKLQTVIEQQFQQANQPGAAVVLKPDTGEVLAMASYPAFDPAIFAAQDAKAIQQVFRDSRSPMINRATDGTYLPGSIIKPFTAMAALEQGIATSSSTVQCPGFLQIGNRKFHCWNRDGHGPIALREALRESCNVYFMEMGRRLGQERLRAALAGVGVARRTGWLMDEQSGWLPLRVRLMEGEVALLAMGQGDILVTPLQAAVMAAALANSGWVAEPWIVKAVGDKEVGRAHLHPLGWSPAHLQVVREGMLAAVNHPQGTGSAAHSDKLRIAGKTGTAQTHVPGKTHAWFIGFCPADKPALAMAVLAEYGGSGGGFPAVTGKIICETLSDE